ncbi:hypothetical protein E4T39_02532 [Aureobasidium subglaciale]|nr:hypothetical protein E4T39_02532 [Aureobasidium subglaciale]
MFTKSITSAILLAGQVINAAAISTTVTLHSVITLTTTVPATTGAATPARFSATDNVTLVTLSSFRDAVSSTTSRTSQPTITVTETVSVPFPVLITVTDYYCSTPTSEVIPSTSTASPKSTPASASGAATTTSSSVASVSNPTQSPVPLSFPFSLFAQELFTTSSSSPSSLL